jgi:HEAT repeats/PBS lyase HEAT-like repeat
MAVKSPGDVEAAAARGDVQYLLEALQDPGFEVREAAALGLGEVGGEKANLALLSVARDRWGERPEVRIAALRSLGRIHERNRYLSILQQFITGDNRKVAAAARGMLREIDPEGFPARLAASGAVDHGAIRVYGVEREASAIPLLCRFLDEAREAGNLVTSRNWGRVYAAVRALGNIGGMDAVVALQRLTAALEKQEAESSGSLALGRIEKILGAARNSIQLARRE